ncbi:MAG: hypothetical protein EXS05_14150 [Planctomycetaceae bacterium]|nr:hypothetical protein [Planctomycetaceae bacterium]
MAYAVQNSRDKKELGAKAPWYARWKDTDGKLHSLRVGKKADALEIARERERNAKLLGAGLTPNVEWTQFRAEYDEQILPGMLSVRSRDSATQALNMFEKLATPKLVAGITNDTMLVFVAKRRKMAGKKAGSKVAAQTISKELRTIKAALGAAHAKRYLSVVPKLPKVDGFESEKGYVTAAHFDLMLANCAAAGKPDDQGYPAEWWWDALLSLMWVAPNRIEAMLSLRWDHVDFERGTVVTLARATKQKRDHRACVPGVVLDKLRRIKRFGDQVFPWPHTPETLYRHFFKIQIAAGIHLPCCGAHTCNASCHMYGFHDFRRSFVTLNAELPSSLKQNQMGHASYQTTQKYERYAEGHAGFADRIYLPPSLQRPATPQN